MRSIESTSALLLFCVVLVACSSEDPANNGLREVENSDDNGREQRTTSVESELESLEELAEQTGVRWRADRDALVADNREAEEAGYGIDEFDSLLLESLPIEQRQRVKSFSFSGTALINQSAFSFDSLPNLSRVSISRTNLRTIRGIEHTPLRRMSLGNVPLSDITPISGLESVEYLWIESTEPIDRLPDLSALTEVTRLGIQANPLVSLDGIETLGATRVILILGLVEDVSALSAVSPEEVFIVMFPEHQEQQPEIVAEIEALGFDVAEMDY